MDGVVAKDRVSITASTLPYTARDFWLALPFILFSVVYDGTEDTYTGRESGSNRSQEVNSKVDICV
jgi:hypothetical protein